MKSLAPDRSQPPAEPLGAATWVHGIRTRLFVAFALLAAALTLLLSFWIEREARVQLEGELTAKLHAVAGSAIAGLRPSLVPGLLSFTPAQARLRTYLDARQELKDLAELTSVRRIFLADLEGRSFVDTDDRVGIGDALPELRAHRPEMRALVAGEASSAPLFTDADGEIRKSGYLPVVLGGEVIGLVGVEADATFLSRVRSLRNRILAVGAAGLAFAVLLAFLLARGFTRPLDRLVEWTRSPAAGDLSRPVPELGRDEIGQLARTLERMREHLESQDRELRSMVSGVAHEIRNPLGGMRLYTEMLARDATLPDKHRERVEKVLGELQQLSNIVDEFLTYARPANPVPEPLDLVASMAELEQWIAAEAAAKGIRFVTSGSGVSLYVDPMHFRQIVRNLVGNALQAVETGGRVEVSWQRTGGTGGGRRVRRPFGDEAPADSVEPRVSEGVLGAIVLLVDDSGPGITSEVRERIFEPFFTTKIHGAGLGLPICRRLALLNRGRIELEESPLGGARFRLTLPEGRLT